MKLINFKNVQQFNSLREKMEAEYIHWSTKSWNERENEEIENLIKTGEYVVKNLDEISIGDNGVLQHNGRAIMVYIPGNSNYKYHLANCSTLETMKSYGRYDRYVITRRDDGKFQTNTKYDKVFYKLSACQNCLRLLGYTASISTAQNFSILKHFENYDTKATERIRPTRYTDENVPTNEYSSDFNKISKQKRANDNYICQECGLNLSHPSAREFLHTHHKNGLKSDNRANNLISLCVGCHSKQPKHNHMKVPQEFRNIVESIENKQLTLPL